MTDIQLHLYNLESSAIVEEEMAQWAKSISTPDQIIKPIYIEITLNDIENKKEKLFFNKIPTSFSLEKEQSDKLIEKAKYLLL